MTEADHGNSAEKKGTVTLAEMLFYSSNPITRRQIETFRVEYEAVHGPTDLTKRYTSTWSSVQQEWLLANDTKRYFDGLPPFAKAFIEGKMRLAARKGNLDNMSDDLLRLYCSGQMTLDIDSRGR